MSITADTITVLSKGGSTKVVKETGMTVADVRTKLGIPSHLKATAGNAELEDNSLVGDYARMSFVQSSSNNADLATMETKDIVNETMEAIQEALVAAKVYQASCKKDSKANPMCDIATRLNASHLISEESAVTILESLPQRCAAHVYELVLRSKGDDKINKALTDIATGIAKAAGRDAQFKQV